MTANLDNATRKHIYRRDGFRCALCDSTKGLQIHHFIHRSEGGSNHPQNLICLCWKCHAVVHGTQMPDYPDYVDREFIHQACAEYLSDFYAGEGIEWYPFRNN